MRGNMRHRLLQTAMITLRQSNGGSDMAIAKNRNRLPESFAKIVAAHVDYCNAIDEMRDHRRAFKRRKALLAGLSPRQQQLFYVTMSAMQRLAFLGGEEAR
jgi:hypothetical protein